MAEFRATSHALRLALALIEAVISTTLDSSALHAVIASSVQHVQQIPHHNPVPCNLQQHGVCFGINILRQMSTFS